MKIRFVTLGCKLNFAESSAIGKALLEQGHTRAKQGEEADICVINTCSVTDNADHKDRQAINRIHRQNPNAIIIVTGCYAQLQPEQIAQIEGVDYVLGQNEKYNITQLVDEIEQLRNNLEDGVPPTGRSHCELQFRDKVSVCAIREVDDFHGAYSKDDRTRCFLKVQDGCNYFCTYCTIPYARGKSRNPKIADVIVEAQQALAEGAKELVLTGVNIGDFGRSTGESFIDLLKALDCLEDASLQFSGRSQSELQVRGERLEARGERREAKGMDYRIRISSCEPNLLTDEIIDFVATSKHFAPHFHIPLQSGSNEVLKIMKRRYTRELFEERVNHIKQVMPHAFIGVDCMVGVRGETEECFNDYVEFIKRLNVSQLHVFTYSERANTRMLELDVCIVPKAERQRRSKILHQISEEKTQTFYAEQTGREAVVLWESKKEGDLMAGFTENYVKVHRTYDKEKVNSFEVVVI